MRNSVIPVLAFTNACSSRSIVRDNGAAMVCATTAKHVILVLTIVGDADARPSVYPVHPVPMMDTPPAVNVATASTMH